MDEKKPDGMPSDPFFEQLARTPLTDQLSLRDALEVLAAYAVSEQLKADFRSALLDCYEDEGAFGNLDDRERAAFLEYFIFDRPLERWGRTPAAVFADSAVGLTDRLRAGFAGLAGSQLDYYRVTGSAEAGVGLKEIGGRFEAFVADRRLGGALSVGDVVLARILHWGGEHRFSGVTSRISSKSAEELVARVEAFKAGATPAAWRDIMRDVPSRLPEAIRRLEARQSDLGADADARGKSEDDLLALALDERKARHPARARELVSEVLRRNPASLRARQILGVLCLEAGDIPEAERICSALAAEEPANVSYCMNLASVYAAARKTADALRTYQRCLLLNPDAKLLPAVLAGIGCNAFLSGDRKQGVAAFRKAAQTCGDDCAGLALVAANLLQFDELDEAGKVVSRMLKLNPDSSDAHFTAGDIHYRQGKFKPALASYRKALELNPGLLEIHMRIGDALLRSDRNAEAAGAYGLYLSAFPGDASALNNLSIALSRAGKLKEARDSLERALTISPEYAPAMSNLAKLCISEGDLGRAAQLLTRAKQLRPGDPVIEELGYLLEEELRRKKREGEKGK